MNPKNSLKLLLFLCVPLLTSGFAKAAPTVTSFSFKGEETAVENVTMMPGETATLTWTFSEPVKPFTFNVSGAIIASSVTAADNTQTKWFAKIKNIPPLEFATINSFIVEGLVSGGIFTDQSVVPFTQWYISDAPWGYNGSYVGQAPVDPRASWCRVDRYISYASWDTNNYNSVSFDTPPTSQLALSTPSISSVPIDTPSPIFYFYTGSYNIRILPQMVSSNAGQIPAPFQAALDGNSFTLVPSTNTGGTTPQFMVQVYDSSGIPVTGVIELAAGNPSTYQSAFVFNLVQNPVPGMDIKGYNFAAGTNINLSNGYISTAQIATGQEFVDQNQQFGPVPDIVDISPVSGGVEGGTTVTITGANLTDVTQVKFGQTNAASFTVNASNVPQTITAISPPMSAGSVDISVGSAIATDYLSGAYTYLATPVLSVTNSTVTYTGNPIAAIVSCSSGGTVTNVKYDNSSTAPTNAGTYAVTANCTANGNYSALTNASAGNFAISQAPQTGFNLMLSATSVSLGSSVNMSSTGGQGDGDVTYTAVSQSLQPSVFSSNVSTATTGLQCNVSGSILTPTGGTGVCVVTATKAANGGYAAAYSAGNVTVTAAPLPNPIPTLSEWAQITMMSLMILTVGWYGRRLKQR